MVRQHEWAAPDHITSGQTERASIHPRRVDISSVSVGRPASDRHECYAFALTLEHNTEAAACRHNSPAPQPAARLGRGVGHGVFLCKERQKREVKPP